MGPGDGGMDCNIGGGCQGDFIKAAVCVTGIALGSSRIANT